MDAMRISPSAISTSACVTTPPSNIRATPAMRLARPEVMPASCSAISGGIPPDRASGTPSADTTAACATPATRVAKWLTSQFKS